MSRAASSRESSASISVIRFASWASLLCMEGFIGLRRAATAEGPAPPAPALRTAS
jgi:hypothetical protein